MDVIDYDRALYYTHRSQWDNLLILMVRTKLRHLDLSLEGSRRQGPCRRRRS